MRMFKKCLMNIAQTWVITMTCMFKLIYFYWQIILKNLETNPLKYMELILLIFYSAPRLAWQACLKKTDVKLELLTDYQTLLLIGERIRGGMCQSTHRDAKANNKYMKNYDKKLEPSYLTYLEANNLFEWEMS